MRMGQGHINVLSVSHFHEFISTHDHSIRGVGPPVIHEGTTPSLLAPEQVRVFFLLVVMSSQLFCHHVHHNCPLEKQ